MINTCIHTASATYCLWLVVRYFIYMQFNIISIITWIVYGYEFASVYTNNSSVYVAF